MGWILDIFLNRIKEAMEEDKNNKKEELEEKDEGESCDYFGENHREGICILKTGVYPSKEEIMLPKYDYFKAQTAEFKRKEEELHKRHLEAERIQSELKEMLRKDKETEQKRKEKQERLEREDKKRDEYFAKYLPNINGLNKIEKSQLNLYSDFMKGNYSAFKDEKSNKIKEDKEKFDMEAKLWQMSPARKSYLKFAEQFEKPRGITKVISSYDVGGTKKVNYIDFAENARYQNWKKANRI